MNQNKKNVQKIKNDQKRIIKYNENSNDSQNKQSYVNDEVNTVIKERNSTKIFPSIHRQSLYKKVNNPKRKTLSKTNRNIQIKESSKSNKNLEINLNNELILGNNLNDSLTKKHKIFHAKNTENSGKITPCVDKYIIKKTKMNTTNKEDKMEVIYLNNTNDKQNLIQSDEKIIDNYKKRFIFDNKKKNSTQSLNSNNLSENKKLNINYNSNFQDIGVKFSNSTTINKGNKKQKIFINLKASALTRHQVSNDNFSNLNRIIKNLNGNSNNKLVSDSNNLDDSSKEAIGSLTSENLKSTKPMTTFCTNQKLNENKNLSSSDKNLDKNSNTRGKTQIKYTYKNVNKDLGIKSKKVNSNRNNKILNYSNNKSIQNAPNKINNMNANLNINYYTFNFSNIFQNIPNNSDLNVLDINLVIPNKFIIQSAKFNSTNKMTGKNPSSDVNTITPKKNQEFNFKKNKNDLKIKTKKPYINSKKNQDNIHIINSSNNKISPRITIKNQSNKIIKSFEMSQTKSSNIIDIEENKQEQEKINNKLRKKNPYLKKSKDPVINKVLSFETFENNSLQKRKNTSVPVKDAGKYFLGSGLIASSNNSIDLKNEKSKDENNAKILALYNNILNCELKEVISDKGSEEDINENKKKNYFCNGTILNPKINLSKKMKNDENFDINQRYQFINYDKKDANNSQNENRSVKNRIINYKTVNRAINIKSSVRNSNEKIKRKINNNNEFNGFYFSSNSLNLLLKMPKKICNNIFKYFDLKSLNTVCLLNKKYNNCFKKIKNSRIRKFVKKLGEISNNKNSNIIKKSLFNYSSLSKLSPPILQKKYMDLLYEDNFADNDIKKDLTRTYPDNELFQKGNAYYNKLYHLLTVYANYNQNIKYAQGLNFLAANTIYYFEKEIDEFVFLDGLIHKFKLENLLGFSNYLNEKLESLNLYIKKKCPNACKHFDDMGLNYSFFTTNWVVTLFANSMGKNHLSSIWDYMIIYGWKFFNCFIVAVLNLYENEILRAEPNQLMRLMKNILKNEDFGTNFAKIIENTFYFIDNEKSILLY